MMSSNAQAWNAKHILLNNLGSKHSLVMNVASLSSITSQKNFIKELYEKCGQDTISRPFLIFKERMPCKKEFEEARMLISTNFDSFTIKYLIQLDHFKNFIFH